MLNVFPAVNRDSHVATVEKMIMIMKEHEGRSISWDIRDCVDGEESVMAEIKCRTRECDKWLAINIK